MTAQLPTTRDEAEDALWRHLQERLAIRRRHQARLGEHADLPFKFKRRSGEVMRSRITTDLTLDGDGKVLAGAISGVWSDDLTQDDLLCIPLLLDAVHEFVRLGILRPVPTTTYYFITHQGAAALENDDIGFSIASDRRVSAFATEFGACPDFDVIHRHLAEAVAAYRANLDLSASVMIGCCYERGLHHLVGAIARYEGRKHVLPGESRVNRRAFVRFCDGKYVSAARLESLCLDALSALAGDLGPHREWIEGSLRGNFYLVRRMRNEAGHPSGESVSREEVATYIGLFNSFYRRLQRLIDDIDALT